MNQNSLHTADFQIKGIEVLEMNLITPQRRFPLNTSFQFEINVEHKGNIGQKLVIAICSVLLFVNNKQERLGNIKTSCIYYLENMEDFVEKESKSLKLPDNIVSAINSISISTTRGVMYSFFRGTFLHNVILPIVDPKGLKIQKRPDTGKTKQ